MGAVSEETATLVAAVDGGEVWTSEAVAGLVGQRPRIAVPWGGLGETEILDARKVGDGIHVTFEVPASAVGELLEMGWRWPSDEATRPARVSLGYLPHPSGDPTQPASLIEVTPAPAVAAAVAEPQPQVPRDWLVFVDVESTGFARRGAPCGLFDGGRLLELALLVVDGDLQEVGRWSSAIGWPDDVIAEMKRSCDTTVLDMHTRSGLWEACRVADPLRFAEIEAVIWLKSLGIEAGTVPMAGSSVHTDRAWLTVHMPDLEGLFHYRCVDVSSVKELARRWYPGWRTGARPVGAHRAMPDLDDTLAELRAYRRSLFRPVPAG